MQQDDVLILGGGHNALVCAAYLAAAKLKVRVLERRGIVGGAAVTEEFHPGFRNSLASYTVSLLNPKVIRELRLHEHGLRIVERPYSNFLPLPDGRSFRLGGEHTLPEISKWSKRDAQRFPEYTAMLDRIVVVLRELLQRTPPNVSDHFVLADWIHSIAVGKQLQSLDMRGQGNGPIAATVDALGLPLRVDHYEERATGSGANAQALAIVEAAMEGVNGATFGAGMSHNIVTASVNAIVSVANRLAHRLPHQAGTTSAHA